MRGSHGTFLLERTDDAQRRARQEILRRHNGLELRRHADPGGGRTYWVAKMDGEPVAAFSTSATPEFASVPEGWMSYIAVDDVDARVKKAVDAGAKVMKPTFDVPGVGRIAILMEPGGAGIGWMTPTS